MTLVPGLVEFSGALDLEHEITAVDVLHHEEQTILGLKRSMDRFKTGNTY
jgi:hypothetical protein